MDEDTLTSGRGMLKQSGPNAQNTGGVQTSKTHALQPRLHELQVRLHCAALHLLVCASQHFQRSYSGARVCNTCASSALVHIFKDRLGATSWDDVLQKADRRLNAQLLSSELDDSLESLQGESGMHSSVMASVRGNSRRQATGVARNKDKADRATYQTVLDPRTRLVG